MAYSALNFIMGNAFLSGPVDEIACGEGVLFVLKIMIQRFNVHRSERVRD